MIFTDLNISDDKQNYVFYCDDALGRIRKAISDGDPYDLLITDLSFDEDTPQMLKTGAALIQAAKKIQPALKVLVFSIENRSSVAKELMNNLDIDGFVPKARRDAKDLELAIAKMAAGKKYLSPNLKRTVNADSVFEFSAYDKTIIRMLAGGSAQKDIPPYLKQHNIEPFSLSSIEKRLNAIKTILDISSNEQLIAYCKDRKVI